MTNFWYPHAIHQVGSGALNLGAADLRVILVLVGTTADLDDANRDVTSISGFVDLKEHTAAGRIALVNETFAKVAAQNWSVLTADPTTWNPLPVSVPPLDVKAAILYQHITDDTDSYPVAWIDEGGYPVTPTGLTRHTINWDLVLGALQVRSKP